MAKTRPDPKLSPKLQQQRTARPVLEFVSENHKFTEGPSSSNNDGTTYFADGGQQKVYKVTPDGKASPFIDAEGGCDGMAMGPDHKLYVNANR